MKSIIRLSGIILCFLVVGCASLPTPEKMKSETTNFTIPVLPPEGKAMVYVVRPSAIGGLIRFNVFVDNKEPKSEMGYTRGSQYIYFPVTPGDHQILSKAENWAEVNISAKAGEVIYIQQNAEMGVLMARNSVVKIQDYEGKYYVKTLKLGTLGAAEDGAADEPKAKKKK